MGLVRKKQKLIEEHLKSISFCTLSVRNPAIFTDGTNRTARTGSAGAVNEPRGVGAEALPAQRCSDGASTAAHRSSPAADGCTGRTPERAKATATEAGDSAVTIAPQLPEQSL